MIAHPQMENVLQQCLLMDTVCCFLTARTEKEVNMKNG